MKFMHLSDLHLGKRLIGWPRIEEQRTVLQEILDIAKAEKPNAVLIAGDIYDRPVPSEEATGLLNSFLVSLCEMNIPVLMISGNHDSSERLSFAASLLDQSHIHISPTYHGPVKRIILSDGLGPVAFHLLPFIRPGDVRRAWPEEAESIVTYTDAVACAIRHMELLPDGRNVLLAHQYVLGAERCDSEEITIGGLDEVMPSVFEPFDYTALGHIHGPQNVTRDGRVRYCGTPLQYSVSERHHHKSVTMVELGKPGETRVTTIPLHMPRPVIRISGSFIDLMNGTVDGLIPDAYIDFILTDEHETPDAVAQLRRLYPWTLGIRYENARTRALEQDFQPQSETPSVGPLEVIRSLYQLQNGTDPDEQQQAYLSDLLRTLREEAVL